ncbi:MAG: tripartite tricarboxylate transporter substrate binding protein [Burkholderiaceae bacterium]|jgi:tripartite-type tricarboxylate transporter receptor subunit TctC|nr:tripartite tricarboxylate transporter substrate binding protein [Polaromonas sp.]MDO8776072.1 tripartite tricarboxylate transporter substrate binding protein [Burkholderiaceae bacterium]
MPHAVTLSRLLPLALLGLLASTIVGAAEPYPTRPIQFIVPFAAGGGLDLNARNFAQALSEVLKQPVAVSNRDGAAGTIGLQAVAVARPDGYTVAFTPAVPLSSEPHRLKSLAYQLDSFKYVCQVFDNIFAVAVPKDSPYQSIQDIVKDARRNAGMVSYGTSGMGSIPHLGTSDIEAVSKVELTHVPYKGDAPMLQDLLTNRLNFGALLASSITSQIQAGSLRLLAVYSDRRHPAFPQVPTLTEAGVPVVQLSFGGLLVPAKTPPEVVATLESGCEKSIQSTAYRDWAQRAHQVIDYQPGAGFEKRLRQDSQQKAATLKRLGL